MLVHLKDFIPKRNRSTYSQEKVLLEIHYSTFQTHNGTHSQCGYFVNIYVKMTHIMGYVSPSFVQSKEWLFFFFKWISRFGMNDTFITLTEHRPVK